MKKIFLFATMFAVSLSMLAQEYMHVWQDGKKTDYVVTEVDSVTFNKMMHNGHEYVDLGLPSGTLWATCNVGATKPEEYGDYFAWGETESKSTYNDLTYKWFAYETIGTNRRFYATKYCTNETYGIVDNKTTLELSDDAAHANWGGNWRMPTAIEQNELYSECTSNWTTHNGVNGYKFVGSNGNSIFLPAAGYCLSIDEIQKLGEEGQYWSSSLDTTMSKFAYLFCCDSNSIKYKSVGWRVRGESIRPVCRQNSMSQREMYIWQNGGKTTFVVADVDSVTFGKENTPPATGTENGYEWVDLGLSVMWATCNVGAKKPEEYGDYFAWGEVEPKTEYSWETYKWCEGDENTLLKYCWYSSLGYHDFRDMKSILDAADDAAIRNWGGRWRMPTYGELIELLNYCTWTWASQNGVNGYKIKSNINDNSIFIPASGYIENNSHLGLGNILKYRSTFIYSGNSNFPMELYCTENFIDWLVNYRYIGCPVRPVCSTADNEANGIIVKAKVPVHWTNTITTWVWQSGKEGKEFFPIKEGDWYVYTHNTDAELNIIFKNGIGWNGEQNQTVDITGIANNTCLEIEQEGLGKATYTIVDCSSGEEGEDNEEAVRPEIPTTGMESDYEWVDLGLSVKWATCNVGASKPEEYGDYFAWGETESKANYTLKNYKWYSKDPDRSYNPINKYNTDAHSGVIVDGKTTLELSDDAAHANWGGSWRMPTHEEQRELCVYCTWTETNQNGVYGYKVTGINGNSIFLPCAGFINENVINTTNGMYYWSNSLEPEQPYWARYLMEPWAGAAQYSQRQARYVGLTVRPVCP